MAAKFVAAVALFALCHANPVLINGFLYRDGRAYSMGKASSSGGGVSTAQANANGNAAQAFGSSTGGAQLARDGYFYPGQAIAQAQTYDAQPFPESPFGSAKAVAQVQNGGYYPVPAPATVITYEQNFAPAVSSESHADSQGDGFAESSANTHGGFGGYGATSSNAKTHGLGSADSNAKSGSGSTSSFAKTHGGGHAASSAQTNGVAGVVYPATPVVLADQPAPAVIDAKSPIYYTSYAPVVPAKAVASSNVNVIGSGQAASSAKIGHGQGRTISWRFGTFYDSPASAQAQANTHGYGAAKSSAHTHGYGSANVNANANGYGSAKSVADSHSGHGIAQSSANSNGAGSANANANVNSAGYGGARSTADVQGQYYGGSRTSADAQTQGFGKATSSASTQGVNTAFRVTNSQANSSGYGSARANALSV